MILPPPAVLYNNPPEVIVLRCSGEDRSEDLISVSVYLCVSGVKYYICVLNLRAFGFWCCWVQRVMAASLDDSHTRYPIQIRLFCSGMWLRGFLQGLIRSILTLLYDLDLQFKRRIRQSSAEKVCVCVCVLCHHIPTWLHKKWQEENRWHTHTQLPGETRQDEARQDETSDRNWKWHLITI